MKKKIFYIIFIILITVCTQSIISCYCLNNVYIGLRAQGEERTYPEYANKIIGAGGIVRNNTIFPVKIKKITPIGIRGMVYVGTLITTWGYSPIEQEDISKYSLLENMIIPPLADFEIGMLHKFTGEYMVNPSVIEVTYSIIGLEFKKVIMN